ncbi:MAG: winged helix-turn-helix domain-containing protein [bacterium]|nr:winged helix-turn-helix domain-containing protein [bacterium]
MTRKHDEVYEFGEFRLNVTERRIERTDRTPVGYLQEKAFQTLVHLVRNSGKLVEKDELLLAVWPDTAVEENNLGKAVYMIRQALQDGIGDKKYIQTIPKHGYRFIADVVPKGKVHDATAPVLPSSAPIKSPSAFTCGGR